MLPGVPEVIPRLMTLVISFWRIRIWRGCGDVESLPITYLEKIIYCYFEVMKFPNQGKYLSKCSKISK